MKLFQYIFSFSAVQMLVIIIAAQNLRCEGETEEYEMRCEGEAEEYQMGRAEEEKEREEKK